MEKYAVPSIYHKHNLTKLTVPVPGSKSITNRALLLAVLADGESTLEGVLFSEDSRYFLSCIQELGFETQVEEENRKIRVKGLGGRILKKEASLYVGSAGTAARFITALLGLSEGSYRLDSSEQMKRRPMDSLLQALEGIGAEVEYEGEEGRFPFKIKGRGAAGEGTCRLTVDVERSSQFLSALLISACCIPQTMEITVRGSHGMAYVDMTVAMMKQFGVNVEKPENGKFIVKAGQGYQARSYQIEPDVSAACYFYAMCPILGVEVTVPGVQEDSMQGDLAFLELLEQMGCKIKKQPGGIRLFPPQGGSYHGIRADMGACSDQAITLAAVAVFADSPTEITGIEHIRFQESDRVSAIAAELNRMGIRCKEKKDGIIIYPGQPKPTQIQTYEDHRMAMGFSLIGLRAEGIEILDPLCCKKTFENYFEVLEQIVSGKEGQP